MYNTSFHCHKLSEIYSVSSTNNIYSNLDKEAADKLSKTVDEACLLLAEYNGRLAAELEDRRQLARMLTEYIGSQKEALMEREKKLEVRTCDSICMLNHFMHSSLGLFAFLSFTHTFFS